MSKKRIANNGNLALQPSYEPENEEELPTNRLYSGKLTILPRLRPSDIGQDEALTESVQNTTDWLKTEMLSDDDLPEEGPQPTGMGQYASAPRIVPTRISRLRIGLRRSTLMLLLAAAVGGSLAGGGYLLATTPWLATVAATTPPASSLTTSKPQTEAQPQVPAVVQPQAPAAGQNQPKDDQQTASALPAGPAPAADAYKKQRDWGIDQYKQGNYGKAIELLEGYVMVNGDDPMAYYQLGLSYMAITGRDHAMDDAEMAFRTATSLQSGWAAPQQGIAESMIRRGFYAQAIAPAEKATQLQPTMTEAWITLGRAYQGAGRDADATRAFAQAARLAPTQPAP